MSSVPSQIAVNGIGIAVWLLRGWWKDRSTWADPQAHLLPGSEPECDWSVESDSSSNGAHNPVWLLCRKWMDEDA